MKIKEYIVLRNDEQHPFLKIKTEIEWNKDFLVTDNIIDFFNEKYFSLFRWAVNRTRNFSNHRHANP